jgi:DNA primase
MNDPSTLHSPERARLVAAPTAAADFFTHQLRSDEGQSPRDYLVRRGLGEALTSPIWSIGHAPPSWDALTKHLQRLGFSRDELLAAGLALSTRRGSVIDRFCDRVTLGVHYMVGDVVAFVGRAAPHANSDAPKHLNSPSTAIYHKSRVLFGLAEQRGPERYQCSSKALSTCLPSSHRTARAHLSASRHAAQP